MKSLLITGASGFVGGFLVEEALARGYDVYAGVRGSSSREYLKDERIKFINLDFGNKEKLKSQLEAFAQTNQSPFDYIVHGAGITKSNNIQHYYDVNFRNTKHFVEALQESNTIPSKFIQVSSLAAFGPGNPATLEPVNHHHQPKPVSSYGKSKLQAEEYFKTLETFPYIILRPTTVYGPREKDLYTVFQMVSNGFEFYIGNKPQHLTFIYVKDLVTVTLDALESPMVQKAYFVADGNTYLSSHLNHLIKTNLNKKTFKLTLPTPIVRALAYSMEKSFGLFGKIPTLNIERVKEFESTNWNVYTEDLFRDFNFKPQYDLERGVKETIAWYKQEKWL